VLKLKEIDFRGFAEQLYSPKELKALLLFVGLGMAVLFYRLGMLLYLQTYAPSLRTVHKSQVAVTDSLFNVLSAKARAEDSLIFALPEDSLLPLHERAQLLHKKGSLLAPHSIVLNAANKLELMELPGVGSATADLILQYRNHAKFHSLSELCNIKSIGKKKFGRMSIYLRLN
jgi:DNA uptake protein ComE-like DNA-binding protein